MKARAARTHTSHLNPSHWQCYSLCWRRRHALKKEQGREKERRETPRRIAYAAVSERSAWAV
jgi:hypothetical protein